MTRYEFDFQMNRLKEVYTEKPYGELRLKEFYARFKSFEYIPFLNAVSKLISESATAPLAPKIMEAYYECLKFSQDTSTPKGYVDFRNKECKFCAGTGVVNARKREGSDYMRPFAFKCKECGSNDYLGHHKGLPDWNDEVHPVYYERMKAPFTGEPVPEKKFNTQALLKDLSNNILRNKEDYQNG